MGGVFPLAWEDTAFIHPILSSEHLKIFTIPLFG